MSEFKLKRYRRLFSSKASYSVTTDKLSYREASHLLVKVNANVGAQDEIQKYHLEDKVIELIIEAKLKRQKIKNVNEVEK